MCTFFMQRGVSNVNPMKMAKCIRELERIYGIKKGGNYGNQYIDMPNTDNLNSPKSQKDLAKDLDISVQQIQDYRKLNDLIPELQTLVETGALKEPV